METLEGVVHEKPFPHLIVQNFYNSEELKLIWEELRFLTNQNKLLEAKDYGGVITHTNSHALILDEVYKNRKFSNILNVNRKLFTSDTLRIFAKIHDCCSIATNCNYDVTKVRYYHNGEYYKPHTDRAFHFLAFSYFNREPKKFGGGELYFPKYEYQYGCINNSMIIFPGWVEHGVNEVKIEDSDYYDGYGRYAITSFFGNKSK